MAHRRGTAGNDRLDGTDDRDFLEGLARDDGLRGGAGDDLLRGGIGDDRIDGGAGNDTVSYIDIAERGVFLDLADVGVLQFANAGGWDTIISIENANGSRFADALSGNDQANLLRGCDGNDRLEGEGGDDELRGGAGDDELDGWTGDNRLYGGAGSDTASIAARLTRDADLAVEDGLLVVRTGGSTVRMSGVETVVFEADGTSLPIELVLDLARSGADAIGTGGDDTIAGTDEADVLFGGIGDDTLRGRGGDDRLIGGAFAGAEGFASDGNNDLEGGDGDDWLSAGNGDNRLDGGAGTDTVDYDDTSYLPLYQPLTGAGPGVTVDLAIGGGQDVRVGPFPVPIPEVRSTLIGVENLNGSRFDDWLKGDGNANRLDGGAGNDRLEGRDGDDTLVGGAGDDVAVFAVGWDEVELTWDGDVLVLAGSEGTDRLEGIEALAFGGATFSLDAFLAAASGTPVVTGTPADDRLEAGSTGTILLGSAGADRLVGGPGDDRIEGGAGPLTLRGTDPYGGVGEIDRVVDVADYGTAAAGVVVDLRLQDQPQDTLGAGVDTLIGIEAVIGSAFDDRLTGEAGDYTIERPGLVVPLPATARIDGGAGDDRIAGAKWGGELTGGTGADHFLFDGGGNRNTVMDFEAGTDVLDLEAVGIDRSDLAVETTPAGEVRLSLDPYDEPFEFRDFVITVRVASGTFDFDRDVLV